MELLLLEVVGGEGLQGCGERDERAGGVGLGLGLELGLDLILHGGELLLHLLNSFGVRAHVVKDLVRIGVRVLSHLGEGSEGEEFLFSGRKLVHGVRRYWDGQDGNGFC